MRVIKKGGDKCKHEFVTMRYEFDGLPTEVRSCCIKCGLVKSNKPLSKLSFK